MPVPILKLENVTVRYGGLTALEDLSLTVEAGDFLCVVGSNGSGKSTLFKAALGLVPLSSGRVRRSGSVGYAPQSGTQNGMERDFPATVRETVLAGTQRPWHFFMDRADREAAEKALSALGLHDLAGRRIGALSGGQAQRVYLARALCVRHDLLLLDEPCAGLDPAMKRVLYDLLERLGKKGTAVVMVTHELDEAGALARRVAVMEHGRLAFVQERARAEKGAEE